MKTGDSDFRRLLKKNSKQLGLFGFLKVILFK